MGCAYVDHDRGWLMAVAKRIAEALSMDLDGAMDVVACWEWELREHRIETVAGAVRFIMKQEGATC